MRGIVIGTGPSLTTQAIDLITRSELLKFGCNLTFQATDLDALYINNREFWQHYSQELREVNCPKWTYHEDIANEHEANFIQGRWEPGLSQDPKYLNWGHGSGYELMGIAYHLGVTEFVLIGYDLRYPQGYSKQTKQPGGDRHFFGEYPKDLEHWPAVGPNGEMTGLLDCYRTIDTDALGIRIINCSPGTALDFFETGELSNYV